MNILSHNPGHDGAIALLKDAQLIFSIEAEKDSNYRHSSTTISDAFGVLGELDELPDVLCTSGWWCRDHYEFLHGSDVRAGYRGVSKAEMIVRQRRMLARSIPHFSSSHERAHLLCAFGMSDLPQGTPCYALIWEGEIVAFDEIDSGLNIRLIADVLDQVGNRYASLYGLADPSFPKEGAFPRPEDAGKLMALASFSTRSVPTAEESSLLDFLLTGTRQPLSAYPNIERISHYNSGLHDPEFRDFAGISSDKIFDIFYRFAKSNMRKRLPLLIAGGCGLNCDWNTKWRESGLFSEVFVPPVANDSGSAIGTAIDAQLHFTGNPKIAWNVYSGLNFDASKHFDLTLYDQREAGSGMVADMLANDLILGWVDGKYEIGPRALGNRSILAAPFLHSTRARLNEIKQREQFRPIAPACLEEDASRWFGCDLESPHMLYTYTARTMALAAVTHVNKTSRIQTVSPRTNPALHDLLAAFKERSGYGVLCNTSLNFKGKGCINRIDDLSNYAVDRGLDGFVVDGRSYFLKSSPKCQQYLAEKTRRG